MDVKRRCQPLCVCFQVLVRLWVPEENRNTDLKCFQKNNMITLGIPTSDDSLLSFPFSEVLLAKKAVS